MKKHKIRFLFIGFILILLIMGCDWKSIIEGCSDGQREAFLDLDRYPNIAGCLGRWDGIKSLREPSTGKSCGDDLGLCDVPADLCAKGWHICGISGDVRELIDQVDADSCHNISNERFVAAISHCIAQTGCQYDRSERPVYPCFEKGWCAEPVCCGVNCKQGSCKSGIYQDDKTYIAQGEDQGCGGITSDRAGGVLCCRDK